jgi:RNA polymerase sigma-70 factor (ECF subfamily)
MSMPGSAAEGTEEDVRQILRHLPRLEQRARTLAQSRADAADLVQDTLEKALRAWPRLRPGSNVGAWLETLLSHAFIDGWRWARRRSGMIGVGSVDIPEPEKETSPRWLDITDVEVRAAIDRLPPMFATVFRLHCYGRLPYAEIARRLDIPCSTVGTRLRRARERLRHILTNDVLNRPSPPSGPTTPEVDAGLAAAPIVATPPAAVTVRVSVAPFVPARTAPPRRAGAVKAA